MVWLVIAIPLVAVIVNFIIASFAVNGFDGVVEDDYYKQGKAINMVLARDDNARAAGIVADLAFNLANQTLSARVHTSSGEIGEEIITARLLHTTQHGHDQEITLTRSESGDYVGQLKPLAAGRFEIHLEGSNWRLVETLGLNHPENLHMEPRPAS